MKRRPNTVHRRHPPWIATTPLLLGTAAVYLLLTGMNTARAGVSVTHPDAVQTAIQRRQDPVVVAGGNFPGLESAPLDELVLYAYHSGVWMPVPFQIDEVNITGTYVISDDNVLGPDDELVFMAADLGEGAPEGTWPADDQVPIHPQYGISVTDPLSPGTGGWAYLFRSTTLTRTNSSYISWDEVGQTVTALSYTAAFTSDFIGLSNFEINNTGVDILDRLKIRVRALIITLDEEDLAALFTPTISLPVSGPVRALNGEGELKVAFYGSRFDFNLAFDTSIIPIAPDFLRTSLDLDDPVLTGIDRYFDSNTPAGVVIDGVPDPISSTPPIDWYQVSGQPNGPGGFVVSFPEADPGGGVLSNYYKDDAAFDPADTGDGLSYADTGLVITNPDPGQLLQLTLVTYILPVSTTANVGATYFDRVTHPLTHTVVDRTLPQQLHLYMPLLVRR